MGDQSRSLWLQCYNCSSPTKGHCISWGFLNGRSAVYCASAGLRATCVWLCQRHVCFAARAAEWKMHCGLTQTELTTAASVKASVLLIWETGDGGGGSERGASANQSFARTETGFRLKVLFYVSLLLFWLFVTHLNESLRGICRLSVVNQFR